MILILVLIGLVLRQERPEALADEAATTADGRPAQPAVGGERCTSGARTHSGVPGPARNSTVQRAAFVHRPRQRRSLDPTREYRSRCRAGSLPATESLPESSWAGPTARGAGYVTGTRAACMAALFLPRPHPPALSSAPTGTQRSARVLPNAGASRGHSHLAFRIPPARPLP